MPDDETNDPQEIAAKSADDLIKAAAHRVQEDRWFFPHGVDYLKLETKVEAPNDVGVSLSIELRGPAPEARRSDKSGLNAMQLTPNVIYAFQATSDTTSAAYIYVLSTGKTPPTGYEAHHEYWFVHASIDELAELPSDMYINTWSEDVAKDIGAVANSADLQLVHGTPSDWNQKPVAPFLQDADFYYSSTDPNVAPVNICLLPGNGGTTEKLDGVLWLEDSAPSTTRKPNGLKLEKQTSDPSWTEFDWHVCL